MIPTARRATVATAVGGGAALTVALPAGFPADGGPSTVDTAVSTPITETVSPGVAAWLVTPSDGPVVLVLLFAAVGWFALHRRWWQAVTMLVVPELAVAVNTWLLKPLWERPIQDYLAYPSGHTVHLVAVATTFACLVSGPRARVAVAALTLLALACALPGMVVLGYHYPTDVLGGAAAAVAMAIGCCALSTALRVRSGRR